MDFLAPRQEENNFLDLVEYLKRSNDEYKRKIAFFIGAGVSKLTGYPLWVDLAKSLKESFCKSGTRGINDINTVNELFNKGNFKRVLSFIKAKDKTLYEEEIKKIFNECHQKLNKNTEIFEIIAELSKLNVIIVTTNIDIELTDALENIGSNHKRISIVPIDGYINDKVLYHLHGRIDQPLSWVLTDDDYAKFYSNEPQRCNQFLNELFSSIRVLVFVGYSIEDKVFEKLLSSEYKILDIFWIQLYNEKLKNKINIDAKYFESILDIKPITYKNEEDLINLMKTLINEVRKPEEKELS
jgi:NAD-dependent SIR2 family protein deacetylase